ncbi:hypothetical protein [Cellvibrio sp. BR]|jgi:hypothetical protein|uniref:hypothetical protein n=1 Tax=Cellvibrio sp. BR TaxID=1134474 RepID=UPI0003188CF3|nr:hypothetical protein [Cellvibrio sp. BR]
MKPYLMNSSRIKNLLSRNTLVTLALLGASCTALAAPNSTPNTPANASYTGWSWSGHVDHVRFDEEAAASQGIEDTATAVGGAAEYYSSNSENTLSLGINVLFYRDNAAFGQYVEDYWGDDVDYEESDANAFMLFAEYGPKYRFGQDNMTFVTVRGGISGILASERSISNCSDCYSEDIEIDGGLYGVIGIGQTLGRLDLSLQFQQYFSGDIDNSLRLKLSGAF